MINAYSWLKVGNNRYHTGLDIANSTGTPIVSPKSGSVIAVEHYGKYSYGNMVTIDHGDGAVTIYGHMSSVSVSVGADVSQGQQIGLMGCSGFCTGPHLHFEVREVTDSGFKLVDPMQYLP
jgi:murein DD-endopeptidase MepM/ murein hydrolase activator NlpD